MEGYLHAGKDGAMERGRKGSKIKVRNYIKLEEGKGVGMEERELGIMVSHMKDLIIIIIREP